MRNTIPSAGSAATPRAGWMASARRHLLVGPPHLWKMKRAFQIDFLKRSGLQPSDHLLDVGCGTLRGGIPLIAYLEPGRYAGIDVRPVALNEAQRELREANLEHKVPELVLTEDLTTVTLNKQFNYVWAFSVLIHMQDDVLAGCLSFVSRHLAAGGRFYANVIAMPMNRLTGWIKWREFPVVAHPLSFYERESARAGLRVLDLGSLWSLGHRSGSPIHDLQRMYLFEPA